MAWLSNSKSRSHVVVGILIVYSLCSSFSNSFLQELSGSPCVLWTPVDSASNSNVRALALALFASSATLQTGWRKLAWLSHHAALMCVYIYTCIINYIYICMYIYIIHTYVHICMCVCVMLCYVILYCIVLYYSILYDIMLYYIILYYIIKYIILYYII